MTSVGAAAEEVAIARAFVDARQAGTALPGYPGTMPATMVAAYRVQDAALSAHAGTVAGWKVGKIAPPVEGHERLSGPIFADTVFDADDGDHAMPIFADGFGAAEAEYLLRVGTAPDPAKTRYTTEEAIALIDAAHVGIEIASSPFAGINENGPAVTVSDFGNNFGLIVGPAIDGWQDGGFVDWPVTLDIDGARIGAATARTMLDGPFGAARFLFENLAARGIAVTPGQWISTGAVTGVHQVKPGARVEATFGDRLTVRCSITAR